MSCVFEFCFEVCLRMFEFRVNPQSVRRCGGLRACRLHDRRLQRSGARLLATGKFGVRVLSSDLCSDLCSSLVLDSTFGVPVGVVVSEHVDYMVGASNGLARAFLPPAAAQKAKPVGWFHIFHRDDLKKIAPR